MLTSELVRVSVRKGVVRPRYLDPLDGEAAERAERLSALFAASAERGAKRQELDEAIESIVGHGTDFLIWRGLAKLLLDRTDFETASSVDPIEIRRALFNASMRPGAALGEESWRRSCVEEVAGELELSAAEVEAGMYADLEARQRIASHKPLAGRALIDRYNLALAQAVLYRATALEIELGRHDPNRLRYLLSSLKFFGLMHQAWRTEVGVLLRIDGPASLFRKSKKYGLQMATFLPALVLMDDWGLRAELDWKGARSERHFELGPDDGLVSHYRARGQWVSDEEKMLEERFSSYDGPWRLVRRGSLVELGDNEVLVADYALEHEDGREVLVEMVGFWRRDYLMRRIEKIAQLGADTPLVLLVSERLQSDRAKIVSAAPGVVFFKSVVFVDKLVEAANHVSGAQPR